MHTRLCSTHSTCLYWELGIVAGDITMDTACIDICAIAPTYKKKEERRRGKKEEGEERRREGVLASVNTGALHKRGREFSGLARLLAAHSCYFELKAK